MASRMATVTTQLRKLILAGELDPGARLIEIPLAKRLGVSRTPLRLALGELEKEGLLERFPTRGFKVREFPMEQVTNAIEVRGVLEGMAAWIVAERGIDAAAQELAYPLLRRAHDDHVSILGAIIQQEGARAEALFREHACRSRENKQALLQGMKQQRGSPTPPGLKLVVGV